MDAVIERVEAARAEGLRITADMYLATAGSTGSMPACRPGSRKAATTRGRATVDPEIRSRVKAE